MHVHVWWQDNACHHTHVEGREIFSVFLDRSTLIETESLHQTAYCRLTGLFFSRDSTISVSHFLQAHWNQRHLSYYIQLMHRYQCTSSGLHNRYFHPLCISPSFVLHCLVICCDQCNNPHLTDEEVGYSSWLNSWCEAKNIGLRIGGRIDVKLCLSPEEHLQQPTLSPSRSISPIARCLVSCSSSRHISPTVVMYDVYVCVIRMMEFLTFCTCQVCTSLWPSSPALGQQHQKRTCCYSLE